MKLSISLEVDSQEEANEVLAALVKIANLPYRLSVFGSGTPVNPAKAVVTEVIELSNMASEDGETSPSDPIETVKPQPQTQDVKASEKVSEEIQERVNVEPPGDAVSRLYATSVEAVKTCLANGRPLSKDYLPVAKRMWMNGDLWYDGTKYQLP